MKKLRIIIHWYWCKLIRRKLIEDKVVLHNCRIYYVNVLTKDMGTVEPKLSIKRTWYFKKIGEHKTIKKLKFHFYFKALNDKNADRKAKNILTKFYNDVQ